MSQKNMSQQHGTFGIVMKPTLQDVTTDSLAQHVYQLLSSVGIRGGDVKYIVVSTQGGYIKVGLSAREVEEYAIKVLQEIPSIMNRYDLRNITVTPESLKVEKMEPAATNFVAEQKVTKPQISKSLVSSNADKPATGKVDNQSQQVTKESPQPTFSISESQLEKTQQSLKNTKKQEKLTQVSVKTSTPKIPSCNCPETIFYHHLQQIGAETRHAEYKKGGAVFDKKTFRDLIGKYMCGFLNSEGGTIFIGVSDDGVVHGVDVDPTFEDTLKNDIVFAVRLIEPNVTPNDYSVNFARIMDLSGELCNDLKVLEVCVRPRDPPKILYSYRHCVYIRRDGSLQNLGYKD